MCARVARWAHNFFSANFLFLFFIEIIDFAWVYLGFLEKNCFLLFSPLDAHV